MKFKTNDLAIAVLEIASVVLKQPWNCHELTVFSKVNKICPSNVFALLCTRVK